MQKVSVAGKYPLTRPRLSHAALPAQVQSRGGQGGPLPAPDGRQGQVPQVHAGGRHRGHRGDGEEDRGDAGQPQAEDGNGLR